MSVLLKPDASGWEDAFHKLMELRHACVLSFLNEEEKNVFRKFLGFSAENPKRFRPDFSTSKTLIEKLDFAHDILIDNGEQEPEMVEGYLNVLNTSNDLRLTHAIRSLGALGDGKARRSLHKILIDSNRNLDIIEDTAINLKRL